MKITKLNAEHYKWGENCDGWHLLKSDSLNVIEESMPPGTSETLHCHQNAQQLFYVLRGNASFEIAGKTVYASVGESVHIPARSLHRIYNEGKDDLNFILVSEPRAQNDRIDILPFTDELKEHIRTLNEEWLNRYFSVEPNDVVQLADPRKEIIEKGGIIFYARHKGAVVGTASLLKIDDSTYELGKMAVSGSSQGLGVGKVLMEHAIHLAIELGVKRLILFSNTSLEPAIHLYKKYGFVKTEFEQGHYSRSNIKMEKLL